MHFPELISIKQTIIGVYNFSFFDSEWSVVHFVSGLLLGFGMIYYYARRQKQLSLVFYTHTNILLLVAWEYFEVLMRWMQVRVPQAAQTIGQVMPHGFFSDEHPLNITADLILGLLALYIAYEYAYAKRWPNTAEQEQDAAPISSASFHHPAAGEKLPMP